MTRHLSNFGNVAGEWFNLFLCFWMIIYEHKERLPFDPKIEKTGRGLRKVSRQRQQKGFEENSNSAKEIFTESRGHPVVT